jgi:hypothetical protein
MKKILLSCFILITSIAYGAQFTLTWTDNSTNETGFRIERAPGLNATTGFAQIAEVGANVTTYVDAGLPNSTSYSYRLRAYNAAGNSGYSNTASGTTPANTPPTITAIADISISKNTNTGAIAFTIGDVSTPIGSLTLSATSNNTTLVPVANIAFGGSGANRTVTVTPVTNQIGSATITVIVNDGSATTSETFVLTVNETAPTAPSGLTMAGVE